MKEANDQNQQMAIENGQEDESENDTMALMNSGNQFLEELISRGGAKEDEKANLRTTLATRLKTYIQEEKKRIMAIVTDRARSRIENSNMDKTMHDLRKLKNGNKIPKSINQGLKNLRNKLKKRRGAMNPKS